MTRHELRPMFPDSVSAAYVFQTESSRGTNSHDNNKDKEHNTPVSRELSRGRRLEWQRTDCQYPRLCRLDIRELVGSLARSSINGTEPALEEAKVR